MSTYAISDAEGSNSLKRSKVSRGRDSEDTHEMLSILRASQDRLSEISGSREAQRADTNIKTMMSIISNLPSVTVGDRSWIVASMLLIHDLALRECFIYSYLISEVRVVCWRLRLVEQGK